MFDKLVKINCYSKNKILKKLPTICWKNFTVVKLIAPK
jgi:hypothetical protein